MIFSFWKRRPLAKQTAKLLSQATAQARESITLAQGVLAPCEANSRLIGQLQVEIDLPYEAKIVEDAVRGELKDIYAPVDESGKEPSPHSRRIRRSRGIRLTSTSSI